MPQKCRTQHYKHKVSYLYLFSYIISTFGVKRCKILCFMKHFYPSLASSQVRVLQNKLNVCDHMSRDITMSQIVWMVRLWYFQKLIFQGTLFIIQFSKRLTYQTSSKLLFFLSHMNVKAMWPRINQWQSAFSWVKFEEYNNSHCA